MFQVFPLERVGIAKNGGRFLERDAMLYEIPGSLPSVPGEHIYVYTIIALLLSRQGCRRVLALPTGLEIDRRPFVDFDSDGQYKNF